MFGFIDRLKAVLTNRWNRDSVAEDSAFMGITVAMSISSLNVPGGGRQWICENLAVLG